MHAYRTHTCGELRKKDVGTRVRLSAGSTGGATMAGCCSSTCATITHHAVHRGAGLAGFAEVDKARSEWVLTLTGEVEARTDDTVNPDMPTGEVDLRIDEAVVQSTAGNCRCPCSATWIIRKTPAEIPLPRLRRERLHENITCALSYLVDPAADDRSGLHRVQTPILTASSPEGARDFSGASRLHPGKFYALRRRRSSSSSSSWWRASTAISRSRPVSATRMRAPIARPESSISSTWK